MRHILIVDDALDLGRMLKTALSVLDPTLPVVVVPSAEEAILEARHYPLDLLVADINLPGISGIELVKKIRISHPDVRVIIITGISDEDVIQEAKALGADAFFRKPIAISEFTDAVQSCLDLNSPDAKPDFVRPEIKATLGADIPSSDRIADILTGMRQSLGTQAVLLLSDRGKIVAQAGDLPASMFDMDWIPQILSAISASVNVSLLLGKRQPEIVLAFRGKVIDIVLAPIGGFALGVILKTGASNLRMALTFEEIINKQKELLTILDEMGFGSHLRPVLSSRAVTTVLHLPEEMIIPEATALEAEDEIDNLAEFEDLFLEPQEMLAGNYVDTFWDSVSVESNRIETSDPDMISFEQAQKMGLAPDDNGDAD
ncbi:MAG: response regulator [Anaerolineaceae bacterium]|nr:response regulator [Anaerolineaceae bacterium]